MAATFEIRLCGFDPKEDAQDGATSWTAYFTTDLIDHQEVIEACIAERPFSKDGVFWNPNLSKVIRKVDECSTVGYAHTLRHEVKCRNCKSVFRGNTRKEAVDKWAEHAKHCN